MKDMLISKWIRICKIAYNEAKQKKWKETPCELCKLNGTCIMYPMGYDNINPNEWEIDAL